MMMILEYNVSMLYICICVCLCSLAYSILRLHTGVRANVLDVVVLPV